MGLEALVNAFLKPVEVLAQMVYDVSPKFVQKGLDVVKEYYVNVKEFGHKYSTRLVDGYVLRPAKWCLDTVYENPWVIAGAAAALIGLYMYPVALPALSSPLLALKYGVVQPSYAATVSFL